MTRLQLVLVAIAGACSHGDAEDTRPVIPVARFMFEYDPTAQPDRVATGRFEIAGVTGDGISVDVPLAKLPADLRSLSVTISFPTPCGPKKIVTPLPTNRHAPPGEPYKFEQVHDPQFGYFFTASLPMRLEYPTPTRVYIDPTTSGPVAIGKITGTVTKGAPDAALAGRAGVPAERGFIVQELDCGGAVTIDGQTTPIPSGSGALFVTSHRDACFGDEVVGYGDQPSRTDSLTGANAYRLRRSAYDFYFAPASARAATSATSTGTDRTRLDRCP